MAQAVGAVEFVVRAMQGSVGSRHQAAEILRKVAEAGDYGDFPDDVTCEQLGQALERICLNSNEEDPMFRVFQAWRQAELERDRRLLEVSRS